MRSSNQRAGACTRSMHTGSGREGSHSLDGTASTSDAPFDPTAAVKVEPTPIVLDNVSYPGTVV